MGRHSSDGRLVIEEDRLARCVTRDEQSGLFEELAQTGHVVGETALFERESARRVDVIQTHREPLRGRTGIGRIDAASGEHVRTTDKIALQVSTQHKNFVTFITVAQRHHRRGRTWTQNFSHSENYADSEVEISRERATTKFGVQTSQGASWPRPPLRRTPLRRTGPRDGRRGSLR